MHVPSGRFDKRIERRVIIEVLCLDESQLNTGAVTENVSPRGARALTDCNHTPGKHVLVTIPQQGVKSLARVVYSQPLGTTKFAVGLHLVVRIDEWGKPASREYAAD